MKSINLIKISAALVIVFTLSGMKVLAQPLIVTIKTDSVSCAGASDATAFVLSVQNGTPPYTYEWTKGGAVLPELTDTIRGLSGGLDYACKVTDFLGKSRRKAFTIWEPNAITIFDVFTTDAVCNGESTGTVEIDALFGTAPLKFSINGGVASQGIRNRKIIITCFTVY